MKSLEEKRDRLNSFKDVIKKIDILPLGLVKTTDVKMDSFWIQSYKVEVIAFGICKSSKVFVKIGDDGNYKDKEIDNRLFYETYKLFKKCKKKFEKERKKLLEEYDAERRDGQWEWVNDEKLNELKKTNKKYFFEIMFRNEDGDYVLMLDFLDFHSGKFINFGDKDVICYRETKKEKLIEYYS